MLRSRAEVQLQRPQSCAMHKADQQEVFGPAATWHCRAPRRGSHERTAEDYSQGTKRIRREGQRVHTQVGWRFR